MERAPSNSRLSLLCSSFAIVSRKALSIKLNSKPGKRYSMFILFPNKKVLMSMMIASFCLFSEMLD